MGRYNLKTKMMKLAILAAVAGSTAAFAPSNPAGASSSALRMSEDTTSVVEAAPASAFEEPNNAPLVEETPPAPVIPAINGWTADAALPCYGLPPRLLRPYRFLQGRRPEHGQALSRGRSLARPGTSSASPPPPSPTAWTCTTPSRTTRSRRCPAPSFPLFPGDQHRRGAAREHRVDGAWPRAAVLAPGNVLPRRYRLRSPWLQAQGRG